jgi:pyruvate kinase
MDDGLIELRVEERTGSGIRCRITGGGRLKNRKGVNFPGIPLRRHAPTPSDLVNARFAVEEEVDFLALSFVQAAADLLRLREELLERDSQIAVIAKIERRSALEDIDAILDACEGIMIARGDLGIESDLSMIPIHQKQLMRKANSRGLPAITATQMLESMTTDPLPTRAEVSDVANAIYDGSDAVMLSGETAVGVDPQRVVEMMRRIAEKVENHLGLDRGWVGSEDRCGRHPEEQTIARAVCDAAARMGARCIAAETFTGRTARCIAAQRPEVPIFAFTPREATHRQLSMSWGVTSILDENAPEDFLRGAPRSIRRLGDLGAVREGDLVVFAARIPVGDGPANAMKLQVV